MLVRGAKVGTYPTRAFFRGGSRCRAANVFFTRTMPSTQRRVAQKVRPDKCQPASPTSKRLPHNKEDPHPSEGMRGRIFPRTMLISASSGMSARSEAHHALAKSALHPRPVQGGTPSASPIPESLGQCRSARSRMTTAQRHLLTLQDSVVMPNPRTTEPHIIV